MIERMIDGDPEMFLGLVAITGGLVIAVVAIAGGIVFSIMKSRDRQRTAREVAAYVAEGSMSPQEGEALLRASEDVKQS